MLGDDELADHHALVARARPRIEERVTSVLRRDGTTALLTFLIFEPPSGGDEWPVELMSNGVVALPVPANQAEGTLVAMGVSVSSEQSTELATPNPNGYVQCVTFADGGLLRTLLPVRSIVEGGSA
jgi:hypothetical protein